jgi:hypothetical protein
MNETGKQLSFTRAALSTGGRPKSKFLPVQYQEGYERLESDRHAL